MPDSPSMDLPGRNLPGRNLPGRNLPVPSLPGRNLPGRNLPVPSLPGRSLPPTITELASPETLANRLSGQELERAAVLLMQASKHTETFQAVLPGEARQIPTRLQDAYRELGLVNDDGWPNFRLTRMKRPNARPLTFVTDVPWSTTMRNGVFPWTDESHAIVSYAISNLNLSDFTSLIDPAAGCGHTPIAMPGENFPRFAMDVNERAIQLTGINSALNQVPVQTVRNDIEQGLPDPVIKGAGARPLFVMNGPFALNPLSGQHGQRTPLPLTVDGGREGTRYTLAGLRALSPLIGSGGRALVLGTSLLHDDSSWLLVDQARTILPTARIRYVVPKMHNWRVDGRKMQPNPFSVDVMATKSKCTLQFPPSTNRQRVHDAYVSLAKEFKHDGYNRLGTVLLDIEL